MLADIHAVMIRDKVRTSTYASFILNSPELFRDAIVMDVGCGTGILSLFAARAGAKRVFAIDASENIVKKAEKVVKDNDLEDVITCVHCYPFSFRNTGIHEIITLASSKAKWKALSYLMALHKSM